MSKSPFNPLDRLALARAVAKALLEQSPEPLPLKEPFSGAGIYAIYYTGGFPPYERISTLNRGNKFGAPIYVGRAVPKGARKGKLIKAKGEAKELYDRLKEHAELVQQAKNLAPEDFWCRYLVVEDIWIPLGERVLIEAYAPLWNRVVDGFGNHDPGTRRKDQWRSDWDVLHPGRPWTEKLGKSKKTEATIRGEIKDYLAGWEPHKL